MRHLAALAAVAFVLSGCASADPAPTATGPGPDAPAPALRWSETSKEGELTVVTGTNPMAVADPQTFQVPSKAQRVWFNITVTAQPSPDVEVRFLEPGCQDLSCAHDVKAAGGQAALELDDPPTGEWGLSFFGDPLPARGTYRLLVNALLPA